jgi:tetratricopeptide (TPR) repeat protein
MTKPSAFPPAGRGATESALIHAVAALRSQRPDEAERMALVVLKANRSHAGAASILAQALGAQNRLAEAIPVLQRVVRASADPKFETLLASALAAAGRHDEAMAQLQRSTARRPVFPPAFLEYAVLLKTMNRRREAIAVLEEGLRLAPEQIELRLQLAALQLAANNRVESRAILRDALEIAPGRTDVMKALARVLFLDGDYAAAAAQLRDALTLTGGDALAQSELGACLLEMGERDAGEAALRAAMHGQPRMIAKGVHTLTGASHGRFFLRRSAATAFLTGRPPQARN